MAASPMGAVSGIVQALGASCRDDARRELLLAHPALNLNGIDFVEFVQPTPSTNLLLVHFLFPVDPGLYGLTGANFPTIRIEGGARIVGITAIESGIKIHGPGPDAFILEIPVSAQGDYSTYWLSFGWTHVASDNSWSFNLPKIDRQFSVAPINFRPGCPIGFDCAPATPALPPPSPGPPLDYLARDFASFQQLLLDLVTQLNPDWIETSPADLGITLLELLAYQGDYLSYFQDVVANEAFLDTVRKRISAKRHARLVDYHMHDGRNAWTYVYFAVDPGAAVTSGSFAPGLQLLTRVDIPLNYPKAPQGPPGVMIDPSWLNFDKDPALLPVKVFETAATVRVNALNNELQLHTWGNKQCCLPAGTTLCHLYAVANGQAILPDLLSNDLVLLEEVKSPVTGAAADADPSHRQIVRITRADPVTDNVYDQTLNPDGSLKLNSGTPLEVLEVGWDSDDALTIPVCATTVLADGTLASGLSVARGNIGVADHGRSVADTALLDPPVSATENYKLSLTRAPLTFQSQAAVGHVVTITQVAVAANVLTITTGQILTDLLAAGLQVTFSGVQKAAFLNGIVTTILSVSGSTFTASLIHANYAPASDSGLARALQLGRQISGQSQLTAVPSISITNVKVAGNVLTITSGQTLTNVLAAGFQITFSGVTAATFLNGVIVTVLTVSGSTFTANLIHANYGPAADTGTASAPQFVAIASLDTDVRSVVPALQLSVTDIAGNVADWAPVPDLLESGEFDSSFVVDVDDDGQGILRFGDNEYGRSIAGTTAITAIYRVGNGSTGNIGADGLAHIVMTIPPAQPQILTVRNPLPAKAGVEPETIEQVRQYAPVAFQATQYRAVTEADYVAAALTLDGVSDAVAQFRWTGSWYTALLGIDPTDPDDVITLPGGATELDSSFAQQITGELWNYKLAGYDLEVRSAQYVSLDIELHLCVNADHFQSDVVQAALQALGTGFNSDGTSEFFNPANFKFGQPVYLSRLYAALDAVQGVDSATVTVFQRYGQPAQGELQSGVIPMGPWQIARLDNDVNRQENGLLVINADGGK
jgi:predicted phage baseplate assembly protein